MLVAPTQITMNSTLYVNSVATASCVLSNGTASSENIAFRRLQNFWSAGMEGGNFRIKSSWNSLYSNVPAGTNMSPMVAVQINQDAFVNMAGHRRLWGTLYAKTDIDCQRTTHFRNDIRIEPTALNTQEGICILGGMTSVSIFWYSAEVLTMSVKTSSL